MPSCPGAEVLPRRDANAEPRRDAREYERGENAHEHQVPVSADVTSQLCSSRARCGNGLLASAWLHVSMAADAATAGTNMARTPATARARGNRRRSGRTRGRFGRRRGTARRLRRREPCAGGRFRCAAAEASLRRDSAPPGAAVALHDPPTQHAQEGRCRTTDRLHVRRPLCGSAAPKTPLPFASAATPTLFYTTRLLNTR